MASGATMRNGRATTPVERSSMATAFTRPSITGIAALILVREAVLSVRARFSYPVHCLQQLGRLN
jgi:hypothetical protein